jgi:gas vesicle protein
MKKFFSFMFGVLTGGIIGAIVALILAPTKGSELREKIRDYTLEISDEVRQATLSKRKELEEKLVRLRKPENKA